MLLHPGAASIDCEDCKQWIYDLETGKRELVRMGSDRREVPQPRPPGVSTPCSSCPKKNPENAEELKLSEKNRKTYQLWKMAKTSNFRCIPDELAQDPILLRNFAELDEIIRQVEQSHQLQILQLAMVQGAKGNVS